MAAARQNPRLRPHSPLLSSAGLKLWQRSAAQPMIAWLVVLPPAKPANQAAAAGTSAGTTFPVSILGANLLPPLNANHWVTSMASNNSFKPKPLRGSA